MLRKFPIIVTVLFLCISTIGYADTVYLNDGSVIEGEIISRDSVSVIIRTNKGAKKYYLSQIKQVEEKADTGTSQPDQVILPEMNDISQNKVRLIYTYLESSGVRDIMDKNLKQTLSTVPEGEQSKYEDLFDLDEILKLLVPIYDKYYTENDLTQMIQFYDSPAGRKAIDSTPKIMRETLEVTTKYFEESVAP